MRPVGLKFHAMDFSFPAQQEPEWKDRVERWYQMDAAAYGIVQAYWSWKDRFKSKPSFLLLASPGASNQTDQSFALSGATSPQKFVHTLPNIRTSPLCQVMEWAGPTLCINKDPHTIVHALAEAAALVAAGETEVWIFSIVLSNDPSGRHAAYLFQVGITLAAPLALSRVSVCTSEKMEDTNFLTWISNHQASAQKRSLLPGGIEISEREVRCEQSFSH